ncbi:MAG: hypothetical protein OXM57_00710 [bacterium]|nr:hypothetical protein [bacterium]
MVGDRVALQQDPVKRWGKRSTIPPDHEKVARAPYRRSRSSTSAVCTEWRTVVGVADRGGYLVVGGLVGGRDHVQ